MAILPEATFGLAIWLRLGFRRFQRREPSRQALALRERRCEPHCTHDPEADRQAGRHERRDRRERDKPGSSAPMRGTRPRPIPTRSTAATSARGRPGSPSLSTCRRRRATTRTTNWQRAKSARSAFRCASRRHAGPLRGDPARHHEHVDDDQRDGALAAGALRRRPDDQGRRAPPSRARLRTTSSRSTSRAAPMCSRPRPPCG